MVDNEMLLAISDLLDTKMGSFKVEIHQELKKDFRELKKELKQDIQDVRQELKQDIQDVRQELTDVRQELKQDIQDVRQELTDVRQELTDVRQELKQDFHFVRFDIENNIKPQLNLLTENLLPAAKRYSQTTEDVEQLKTDVKLLKEVVREHSIKFQLIS